MKKAIAALLAAVLSLSLAACGGVASGSASDSETAEAESTTTAEPTETPTPTPDPSLITITGTLQENREAYSEEIDALRYPEDGSEYYVKYSDRSIKSDTPVTFELNGEEFTGNAFDIYLLVEQGVAGGLSYSDCYLIKDNPNGTFRLTGHFEPTEHENGEVDTEDDMVGTVYSGVYYFYPNGNYIFKVSTAEILSDPWMTPDAENDLPEVTVTGVSSMRDWADTITKYNTSYDNTTYSDAYVITFDEPITVEADGSQVTVTEATLKTSSRIDTDFRTSYNESGLSTGNCKLTGTLVKNENWANGHIGPYTDDDGNQYYIFNPCEYTFYVTGGEYSE